MTENTDQPTMEQIAAESPRLANSIELFASIIRRVFIAILEDGGLDPSDHEVQKRYKDHAVLIQTAAFATVVGADAETVEQIAAKFDTDNVLNLLVKKVSPGYHQGIKTAADTIASELNSHAREYLEQTAAAYRKLVTEHPSGWDKIQEKDAESLGTFAGMGL